MNKPQPARLGGSSEGKEHDVVNHPNRKLTPALRSMLERIARATDACGALLEMAITASGGREPGKLQTLLRERWAERCDHPTVMAGRYPADAVRVTNAGRTVLGNT